MTLTEQQRQEFIKHFNTQINRFWHPFFGFDIIKFDEWIGTPDGTSTRDYIAQKYSPEAAQFISDMLHIRLQETQP